MKEVTEWDNNPRMMWVWDVDERSRRKEFVFYIMPRGISTELPVFVKDGSERGYNRFYHCAEIENTHRLMTNKELARWLREKPDREWKGKDEAFVHSDLIYRASEEDEPVSDDIYVREGDSPWFVPFTEGE